jgi:hypothetical protein
MKTVPSGRLETCMKGASAVGGTEGAIIWKAPESVGRPLGRPPPVVAVPAPVITGIDPVAVFDSPEPVMTPVGDGPVVVSSVPLAAALSVALPVVCPASGEEAEAAEFAADRDASPFERFGSDVSSAANVAMVKKEIATTESSGIREDLMTCFSAEL